MDFVIRRRMLLKEERKWLILHVRVQRSCFTLVQFMQEELRQTQRGRMCYQCVFCSYMSSEFNACSYSLTSCVNFGCHSQTEFWSRPKHVSSVYSSGCGAPFHFLSQRSKSGDLWSAAQPLNNSWHWLVFSLIFSPCLSFFFFGQHTWLCCGRLLFI